jgi:hypothetical protein
MFSKIAQKNMLSAVNVPGHFEVSMLAGLSAKNLGKKASNNNYCWNTVRDDQFFFQSSQKIAQQVVDDGP